MGAGETKIVQGWPKLWANFTALDLMGVFSQSVGPSLAIWANPVHFFFFVFCTMELGEQAE